MKTQHTPGPWKFDSTDRVCQVFLGDGSRRYEFPPSDAANARLIAAAPDLLTALQTMVIGQEMGHFSADAYAVARAAIAKARGES